MTETHKKVQKKQAIRNPINLSISAELLLLGYNLLIEIIQIIIKTHVFPTQLKILFLAWLVAISTGYTVFIKICKILLSSWMSYSSMIFLLLLSCLNINLNCNVKYTHWRYWIDSKIMWIEITIANQAFAKVGCSEWNSHTWANVFTIQPYSYVNGLWESLSMM